MAVTSATPSPTPPARARAGGRAARRNWWVGWVLVAVAGVGVAAISLPSYLDADPSTTRIPSNPNVPTHQLWVALHAVPASLALAIGPFQFLSRLCRDRPAVHRWSGRVYLVCVLFSALVSIPAALVSTSGVAAQIAFLLLALAWTYSGVMAHRTARARQFQLHRVWMIRDYALSFAAVMLRVFLGIGLLAVQRWEWLTFDAVYTSAAWAGVLVSYVVAEWFIVQRVVEPPLRPRASRAATRGAPVDGVPVATGPAQ